MAALAGRRQAVRIVAGWAPGGLEGVCGTGVSVLMGEPVGPAVQAELPRSFLGGSLCQQEAQRTPRLGRPWCRQR